MDNVSEIDNQTIEYPLNSLQNISGKGELSINGNLNLSGIYSGKLNVSECLVVGKGSVIIGEFRVKDLIVYGKIIGRVFVSNRAELHENSVISGTLTAKEIKKHPGSSLNGQKETKKQSEPPIPVLKTGT